MNPFSWVRRRIAESVVQGFADGIVAVTPEGEDSPDIVDLRQRLAAAVSQPRALEAAAEEPKKKGR